MEEILASIRRIIAEDSDTVRAPMHHEPEPAPAVAEDVLELTEIVAEAPEPPRVIEPEPDPVPVVPPPMLEPDTEKTYRASSKPRRIEHPVATEEEPIVSASPAAASTAAFAEMTSRVRERRNSDVALGNGGLTIEDMIREMLKPLLREWLDANLPNTVERLVHEEIKRLSREAL